MPDSEGLPTITEPSLMDTPAQVLSRVLPRPTGGVVERRARIVARQSSRLHQRSHRKGDNPARHSDGARDVYGEYFRGR